MSYLTINKKAVSPDDARKLLDQTQALPDSFGIPTHVLHLKDFEKYVLGTRKAVFGFKSDELRDAVVARIGKHPEPVRPGWGLKALFYRRGDISDRVFENIREMFYEINSANPACSTYPLRHDKANFYKPGTYQNPQFGVILVPKQSMSANYFRDECLDVVSPLYQSSLPGMDEAWQFHTLWHEKAHVTGAGEPQAEMIASLVTRQAFVDQRFVATQADLRALETILLPHRAAGYGWPTVEAIDYAMTLPQERVDAMSEGDIRDVRFQSFNQLNKTVAHVAKLIRRQYGYNPIANYPQASRLEEIARKFRHSNTLNDTANQILARFELASLRVGRGSGAYDEGAAGIPEKLLESERAKPLTFKPGEYIPE